MQLFVSNEQSIVDFESGECNRVVVWLPVAIDVWIRVDRKDT